MMNISYRKLLPEESKIYRSIRLESLEKFPESFAARYQEALKIEKFPMENHIEKETAERFVWGAFTDTSLIGICTFVKNEDNTGTIYQMYVKTEYQGKNIGMRLMETVIHEIREKFNGIIILLEVAPGNDKAYHLYQKIGFQNLSNRLDEERNSSIIMQYITE